MNRADEQRLFEHAERSIAEGSKSFALAARLFAPATRRSAVLLYAWCRHCDDVIDGQQAGHDARPLAPDEAARRLAQLRERTLAAYAEGPLDEPAFAAFQYVARRHGIRRREAFDLLEGFAMDVQGQHYACIEDTLRYCYHVAGVVGLMMARIMGVRDEKVLDHACDLGLGMQLTNIARDIVDDAKLGRCYLPADWLAELGLAPERIASVEQRQGLAQVARRLVELAEPYYASAQSGMAALPWRSAWAVATAAEVYRRIGLKVVAAHEHAWTQRISTSRRDKLGASAVGLWRALSARLRRSPGRDPRLWQRPSRPGAADRHGASAAVPASDR